MPAGLPVQPLPQFALLAPGQRTHRLRVGRLPLDQRQRLQHRVVQVGGHVGAGVGEQLVLPGAGQLAAHPQHPRQRRGDPARDGPAEDVEQPRHLTEGLAEHHDGDRRHPARPARRRSRPIVVQCAEQRPEPAAAAGVAAHLAGGRDRSACHQIRPSPSGCQHPGQRASRRAPTLWPAPATAAPSRAGPARPPPRGRPDAGQPRWHGRSIPVRPAASRPGASRPASGAGHHQPQQQVEPTTPGEPGRGQHHEHRPQRQHRPAQVVGQARRTPRPARPR